MSASFLDHFSALEDPRQHWKTIYPLEEILLIVLCGTLSGADDFVEMERWALGKLDFLRRLLPFQSGIPSHDTLNGVLNALPADEFAVCFTAWVQSLRKNEPDIVAIDGKPAAVRITGAKANGPCTLSLPGPRASGWCLGNRLVRKSQTRSRLFPCCWKSWN